MRIQQLGGRPPEEISVAGVTLRDLLGDVVTLAHVHGQFSGDPLSDRMADVLKEDDEVGVFALRHGHGRTCPVGKDSW
jgi:hypothetical protein